MSRVSGPGRAMLAVRSVGGVKSLVEPRLRLIVQLTDVRAETSDGRLQLCTGFQQFQALGDQGGYRLDRKSVV